MTNFEKRVEIVEVINNEITQALKDGKIDDYKVEEFDRRFYKEMMALKEQGQNLWFTEGEEQFYKNQIGGE